MAVSAWAASTAFSVGDIVRPSDASAYFGLGSGLFFRCTVAGTSDSTTEPQWPQRLGNTVVDNTCTWQAIQSAYEFISKLAPSAIIELFELRLIAGVNTSESNPPPIRFHAGANANVDGNIVWNGNQYTRLPIVADGFEYKNTGTLPRPTLTISNLNSSVTALLLEANNITAGNDLGLAEVRRVRTLKRFLDGETSADPNAKFPDEIWFIDRKANESLDSVTFELASKFDVAGQKLPKRQIIANICPWKYKDTETCNYQGTNYFDANDNPVDDVSADVCGKRLESCQLRFGQLSPPEALRFGGFPGAGLFE